MKYTLSIFPLLLFCFTEFNAMDKPKSVLVPDLVRKILVLALSPLPSKDFDSIISPKDRWNPRTSEKEIMLSRIQSLYKWEFIETQSFLSRLCHSDKRSTYEYLNFFQNGTPIDRDLAQGNGPNHTQDILIAGNTGTAWPPTISISFKHMGNNSSKVVQKPDYNLLIPEQRLILSALAPSRAFAILGCNTRDQFLLSWGSYKNCIPRLINKSLLPGALRQMAFVSPGVLLAISPGKKLVTFWLDDKRQLRYQFHKTPPIEKFAVNHEIPEFLAFTYEEEKITYSKDSVPVGKRKYLIAAFCSLKNINNGKCSFKTKTLSVPRPDHQLRFEHDSIIIKGKNYEGKITEIWRVLPHLAPINRIKIN